MDPILSHGEKNERTIMNNAKQRLFSWCMAALGAGYFCILVFRYAAIPINSDFANLVLEGNEVLHGNFFRNGWILSGVSFTATDIPFYTLAAAVFGVGLKAYVLAVASMLFFAMAAGFILMEGAFSRVKEKAAAAVIFFTVIAVPCEYWLSIARAHTGSMAWAFLGLFFAERYLAEKGRKRDAALCCLFFTLSTWGDSVPILALILPLAVVLLWKQALCMIRGTAAGGKNLPAAGLSALGCALGLGLDSLYFALGSADKNDFFGMIGFTAFEDLGDRFALWFRCLLRMHDGAFWGEDLFRFETLLYFLHCLMILVGFCLAVYHVVQLVRGKETDTVCTTLSLGFFILSLFYIVTGASVDELSFRYFSYAPVALAVVMARDALALAKSWENPGAARTMSLCALPVSLLLIISSALPFSGEEAYDYGADRRLAAALEAKGLTTGYADFWCASKMTVISKEKVNIRAIRGHNGRFSPLKWICKEEWYKEEARFVLVDDAWTVFGVTDDTVTAYFGEPQEIMEIDHLRVYIYDRDISIKDAWQEAPQYVEYGMNSRIFFSSWDDYRSSGPGMLLYGPYDTLKAGRYTISFYFSWDGKPDEDTNLGFVDIYSNRMEEEKEVIAKKDITLADGMSFSGKVGKITLENVEIPRTLREMELRMYVNEPGIKALRVSVEKVD